LHFAAFVDDFQMVKTIVENGGRIDLKDNNGYTPIYYSFINENNDIIEYLIHQGANLMNVDITSHVYILGFHLLFGLLE